MHPFQVMAEPIRRRIVEILASGEHSSGEIAEAIEREFGVTRSAVSKHLAILRNEEWVIVRAEWSNRMYRLHDEALRPLEIELGRLRYLWLRRIGTIARNDPMPGHAQPSELRRYKRGEPGVLRGWRGKGRKEDPWSPAELRNPREL
ncbi:MAG: ArsR/SmtB family transcription factor [Lacisediminihabitans sp.]